MHPNMLRAAFIMAALDVGVPLRDDEGLRRVPSELDHHAAYVVVAFVAGADPHLAASLVHVCDASDPPARFRTGPRCCQLM